MLLCHTSDETLKEQSTGPDLGTAVPVLMGMLTKESSGQEIENARAYEGKLCLLSGSMHSTGICVIVYK